jgi:hypothetical protein
MKINATGLINERIEEYQYKKRLMIAKNYLKTLEFSKISILDIDGSFESSISCKNNIKYH